MNGASYIEFFFSIIIMMRRIVHGLEQIIVGGGYRKDF